MSLKHFRKILGWSALIFFILACASPLAPQPTPTLPAPVESIQETLNAAIAGTAAEAQTQTATMMPPTSTLAPTYTPTNTRVPTQTSEPGTPTPTFYYIYATPTNEVYIQETLAASTSTAEYLKSINAVDIGGGYIITSIPTERWTQGNQWRCAVRYSPHPVVIPGQKFEAYWTVVNIGWNAWAGNTVDVVYNSGLRTGRLNIHDISSTVGYGKTLTFGGTFTAPKRIGTYNSSYIVRVDAKRPTELCRLKMTVEVKR